MKKKFKEYERFFELDKENDVLRVDPEIIKRRKEIGTKLLWEMMTFFGGCTKYKTCSLCGYSGAAIDSHHVHGRKVSDETIVVCANCHREIHAGVRSI